MQVTPIDQAAQDNPLSEVNLVAEEVVEAARNSPEFLAALATPTIFEYGWPLIFLNIWGKLVELAMKSRDFSWVAVGLPRGFGKTTVIKLFILYCILFTRKQFILILSANATLAENILSDVMDMLDEPNIKAVFGDWRLGCEKDTNPLKKFGFRGRNIIIAALGAGGSVRGLNLKNARPDVMIFEDVQTREDADSQPVSDGLYRWMLGTAMKAKSPKGCLSIFIANMYPTPHSILKKLKENPLWLKFIAPGILVGEDGKLESLWEDLQPIAQLLREYAGDAASGHPEIFHAEILNDETAQANNSLDSTKVTKFSGDEYELHQGSYIIIDPATGKANKDAVSIGYFQVHDARPVCWDLEVGAFSPKVCIDIALRFCAKYQCTLIVIEGVAYQSTLGFWFNWMCRHYGIEGISAVDIYPGVRSKNSRILTMFKQLMSGEIILHPRVWSQCITEAQGFNPVKTDNVDGILDLLTYSPIVINKFEQYLQGGTVLEMQKSQELELIEYAADGANSPF